MISINVSKELAKAIVNMTYAPYSGSLEPTSVEGCREWDSLLATVVRKFKLESYRSELESRKITREKP